MSADDRELIERLLDAGRRDAAPDGTERQARILRRRSRRRRWW